MAGRSSGIKRALRGSRDHEREPTGRERRGEETHGLFSSRRESRTRRARPHRPGLRARTAGLRTAPRLPRLLRYVDSAGGDLATTCVALMMPQLWQPRAPSLGKKRYLSLPRRPPRGVGSRPEAPSQPKPRRVASACCSFLPSHWFRSRRRWWGRRAGPREADELRRAGGRGELRLGEYSTRVSTLSRRSSVKERFPLRAQINRPD